MNRPLRRIGANIAFLLLDGGMAFLGFRLAYWARYELQIGRAIEPPNYLPFDRFLWIGLTLVALVLLLLGGRGFYRLPRGTSWSEILAQIGGATTVGVSILIVLLYGTRTLYTRLLYAYAWLAIIVTLSVGRFLVSRLQRWLWQQGIGAERVLVVGAGPLGQQVIRGILQQPQLGYFLVGYLEANPLPVAPLGGSATSREVPRYLGRVEDLSLLLEPCNIDEVIIALPSEAHQTTLAVAAHCRNEGIEFRVAPDLYEMSFDRVDVAQLAGVPLIGLKEVAIRGWNLVLKRAMDIILSLMTIAVAWPLMGLIAVLIKLDSPGPVLYRQKRIGRKGRPFTVFKFRTMRQHAELEQERLLTMNEATGPLFKIRDDPRRTRVGRILRRTSLDELPQVINILLGEMSWVGPRPGTPAEVAQYRPWQRQRLEVLPGLTGFWQISGRSDVPFVEMVRMDIYYIENWSLWLDIVILMRTIPAIISGKGAY